MVSLLRWLVGFVRFSFCGGFADGFINDCKNARLGVKNLKYQNGVLTGECLPRRYLSVCRTARQHGGKTRIVKKVGVFLPLLKIKNRTGLAVGAVLFVLLVSSLTGCIWQVDIVGNERISAAEIRTLLEENGLREGARWRHIKKDDIASLLLASFPDCAWAHINETGTVARVEISEGEQPPPMANNRGVANVRAKCDGVIVSIDAHDGWVAVRRGDSVTKGALLISGIYSGEKQKGNQFTHAAGVCMAQVKLPLRLTVSRVQSEKVPAGQRTYRTLRFFHLKIPLYLGRKQLQNAAVSTETSALRLHQTALPVGMITQTAQYYAVQKRVLTDRELAELTEKEIAKKIAADYPDCKVLKRKLNTALNADNARVTGTLTCLRDIGEEVPVKIKKAKDKNKAIRR